MRRRQHGRRLAAGLVTAGLLTVGLLPVAAHAAEGANLALGRPVTASGAHGSYPASNVTDGSQSSYWEGPAGSFPQWVQVDLGSTADIDGVVLKLPASWESRTEGVRVQASADGRNFTTVVADARKDFSPSSGNTVALDVTAEARYVRVQVTGNTGWNAAQLSEVEVRGEAGGEDPGDPPAGTNLALRKPIEASSTTQNYIAANANDGSTASYWEANGQSSTLTAKLGADADLT
ncbi:discoidin domain-containing protein, partial [Streptomyces sp. NPDC020125]|uniref:discoidin domain-containing protein n=1 Tax=Streptomyces sp. NPDC020125 TaxID=3154593 RepID=UPI0033DFB4E8